MEAFSVEHLETRLEMECRHSGAKFEQLDNFKSHLDCHVEIQKAVYPARSYGAVYRPAPARSTGTPATSGTSPGNHGQESRSQTNAEPDILGGEYPCGFCQLKFPTRQHLSDHERSSGCEETKVVCWVLIIDSYQKNGYRIEERHLRSSRAHNSIQWLFRCDKCDLAYATEDDRDLHRKAHQKEHHQCEHCAKLFDSKHELLAHYDWHYDVQADHYVELALMRGEKSQEPRSPADINLSKEPDFSKRAQKSRCDGEIVALSFVSGPDLKIAFTSGKTGKFHELKFMGNSPVYSVRYDPDLTAPRQGETLEGHLRYLRPTNHSKFLESAEHGRGSCIDSWLSHNLAYRQWLNPSLGGHYLWVHGPSGCGKSACAARAVENCLDNRAKSTSGAAVVYFLFNDLVEDRRTIASFLRTAISQLFRLRPDLSARVPLAHIPLIEGVPLDHLWATLRALVTYFQHTYCILDGLDQLNLSSRSELMKPIQELSSYHGEKARILVTSCQRPDNNPSLVRTLGWTEVEIPSQIIYKDIESTSASLLQLNQKAGLTPPSNNLTVELLAKNSMGSFNYTNLVTKTHLESLDRPIPKNLDELFSEILRELSQKHPLLWHRVLKLLQWMVVSPTTLTIGELDDLLALSHYPDVPISDIIREYLQALIEGPDSEGYVRFTTSSVKQYLITGATEVRYSGIDSPQHSPVTPLKQAHRDTAIELLRHMATPVFAAQVERQSVGDAAKHGLLRIASSRWNWFVARTTPTMELISQLTKFTEATSFQKLFTSSAQRDPCLAIAQCHDVELEKWLQNAPGLADIKTIQVHLAQCRNLVFHTIGDTLPSDHLGALRVANCLAQLHAHSQLPDTALKTFRQCLELARQWSRFPEALHKNLPFSIFGHTIDEGKILAIKDVHNRLLGVPSGAPFASLIVEAQALSDSAALRNRILDRLQQMRKFKRYGLHNEAVILKQELRRKIEPLRWDYYSPVDTVIGLAWFLLEHGRDGEADTLLEAAVPAMVEEAPVVLICCSLASGLDQPSLDQQRRVRLANAKMDALGTSWEAILAMERRGRHYTELDDSFTGIIFNKRAYQLSREYADLNDSRTFHCLRGLVSAHLAAADMDSVTKLFVDIGSLSALQMRELTPTYPCSKMNYATMMQQFGLKELFDSIINELADWLSTPRLLGESTRVRNIVSMNIGGGLTRLARAQEGELILKRVLAEPEGLSHTQIALAKNNLAVCLRHQLRTTEADALLEEIEAEGVDFESSTGLDRTFVVR